jgi:hypothetical protein
MAKLESLITVLDRSKKRLALAFCVALFLHLPLTPAMPVLKLVQRITGANAKKEAKATPPQEIEVELEEALRSEEKRLQDERVSAPAKAASVQVEPPPHVKLARSEPKASSAKNEAKAAHLKKEARPEHSVNADNRAKQAKKAKVKDLGLEGDLASKVGKRPAVTLALWFSSLRETAVGKGLIDIAACHRDWKRFVDQGINLSTDIDGVLVIGPGIFESSQLTVAVGHSLAAERVNGVIDAFVKDSGDQGRWISSDVAAVRFGRRERVLLPLQPDLFFVTPRDGWKGLHGVKSPLRVPSAEGRAASLVLVGPHRILERIGLNLPASISEMRVEAFANRDRSVDLRVELQAKSPEAAGASETEVSRLMRDFFSELWTGAAVLGAIAGTSTADASREPAPRLDLEADGPTLSGGVHLSPKQTEATLNLLSSYVCRKPRPEPGAEAAPHAK